MDTEGERLEAIMDEHLSQSDWPGALNAAQRWYDYVAKNHGESHGEAARPCYLLAICAFHCGDFERARRGVESALGLAELHGNDSLALECTLFLLHCQPQPENSERLLRDGIERATRTDDPHLIGFHFFAGELQNKRGNVIGATEQYSRAVQVYADWSNKPEAFEANPDAIRILDIWLARTALAMARISRELGDYQQAREYAERAVSTFESFRPGSVDSELDAARRELDSIPK